MMLNIFVFQINLIYLFGDLIEVLRLLGCYYITISVAFIDWINNFLIVIWKNVSTFILIVYQKKKNHLYHNT